MILEHLVTARTSSGFTIFAMEGVRDALEELDDSQRSAVVALLGWVAQEGPPKNRDKCWKLGDGIFELKPGQTRLPFFYDPATSRIIIVTHHFKKQKQKTPPREIRRAKDARDEIAKARKEGNLTYEKLD